MPLQTLTPELAAQIAADYPALQSLNLSNNALRDVRYLKMLPRSLMQLDLGGNRLCALPEELSEWLPDLKLLRLRCNALESLRPLSGCNKLQTLDVGGNRMALVSELRFLQSLTQLRHLSLDGNPIANATTYRRETLAMLPLLQSLDGQEVTAAEKLNAKLQLTTPVDSRTVSPAPSPTRLLTPERLQKTSEAESISSISTASRVRAASEKEGQKEEHKDGRVEVIDSDSMKRLPSPLVLASASTPAIRPRPLPGKSVSIQTKISGPHAGSTRQEYSDFFIGRDHERTPYHTVSKVCKDHNGSVFDATTRETLLQSRVEALEAILAVHDKTMKSTLARFGEHYGGSTKSGGAVALTVESAAVTYTRLLAVWREKCVALMVQAQSSELANDAIISEYRQQEVQLSEELARCEEEVEMWQQRAADFEAQRDLEAVATRQAQDQRAQADSKAVQVVRGLALEREKLRRLAETVVRFTGGLVRDKVEQLHDGSARLEALEQRLVHAKERVELAATLVTHRETRLRNSEAALEAERRVWAHRLEILSNKRLQENEAANENGGDISNVAVRPPSEGKILRPVTETALRNLFHRLDPYDTGLVRSQVLVQALRRGDPGVLSAVGGPKKLSKLVAHVEDAIRKLAPAGRMLSTLTWGEFLLFFIPESSVSLTVLLEDAEGGGADETLDPDKLSGPCHLCTAVKTIGLPVWQFESPQPTDQTEGETKATKKRKERKAALESLSHTELAQQNSILLADREHLRRLLARDAHDLRDRVRSVRREWELKASELAHRNDILQQSLNEQTRTQHDVEKCREAAEVGRDKALQEVERLREQLSSQKEEFELHQKKLEAESVERLQHEQDIWQTEIQDARLAHSLLQADHSKQQVRIRQLERDLARQKEALLAHESERVASLEDKVRRRDSELARLRRERNSILSSLREQEQKLALASAPVKSTPMESIAIQTEEAPLVKQKTVASQTNPAKPPICTRTYERAEVAGSPMNINEISTPNSLADDEVPTESMTLPLPGTHLTAEDVNLRLQKLQSLTERLLAD
ncbi:Protein tilB [Phytophthora citrophthora]|uniref:Protein tilB n=1 Tax=Phytophthora citrophthora TaxID=4793 RepID=A0AAD9LMB3_9STRA|nr:Protein tilB [Phytophthora citrophthora]